MICVLTPELRRRSLIDSIRQSIAAGGAGYLTSDGVDLLGSGRSDDETTWAVERLLADNIATSAEIAKAKS